MRGDAPRLRIRRRRVSLRKRPPAHRRSEVHSSSPVLVIADADEVGRRAARSSAFALRDAGVFARAIDLFPSRTDGFDVADALREHDKRSDATDWLMNRLAPFVKEG